MAGIVGTTGHGALAATQRPAATGASDAHSQTCLPLVAETIVVLMALGVQWANMNSYTSMLMDVSLQQLIVHKAAAEAIHAQHQWTSWICTAVIVMIFAPRVIHQLTPDHQRMAASIALRLRDAL